MAIGPVDSWIAAALQRKLTRVGLRLELWDGSSPYEGPQPPTGEIAVRDRRALLGLVIRPELYFGEGYMTSRVVVRGHLTRVLEAIGRLTPAKAPWIEALAWAMARPNTLHASRRNVHHHYDLGNDFYQSWLDEQLVYTCAYFNDPDEDLEAAQRAKMDLVCRKLRLQPGETVIEAGCGWGALALHMARSYGARVKAFNVSREQIAYARERAGREGLADRVEFIDDDYRNVTGTCDAFVSVGMLEHVGVPHYESLANVLTRVLPTAGGRGLLHFIGRDIARPLNSWIRRRIFPGAYPPTLAEVTTKVLGPARMSVLDIENLRLHYARTLVHWSQRFAVIEQQVRARYGEEFRRAWELYLAGSEAAFSAGSLQLFQVVFAPVASEPPYWKRADVYCTESAEQWFAATR
jgi:cyclopropane-fatty-acyl-phospholipid synthase